MVDSAYFVKSTILELSMLCRYVTDILKMCMKQYDVENIFFDKLTVFLTKSFSDNCT